MRIKRRLTVVCALAVAGVLAAGSVALATSSTETFTFKKKGGTNALGIGAAGKFGSLNVHTHTNYTIGGQKTHRARLYFDNAFTFNTSIAPKCTAAQVSGNITMATAMAACGSSLVGTGTAKANAAVPGDVPACVLAFNRNPVGLLLLTRAAVGSPTIDCTNPAANTNGNTSVLLSAPLANNPGSLPADFRTPAPNGKFLDFNNIDVVSALPLSDFNVTVTKGNNTSSGYVKAKCNDNPKKLNMRTVFDYINPTTGGPQTVNSLQTCS